MASWILGIDFGTTYTAAAVSDGTGQVQLVDPEHQGASRMPSAVCLGDDGQIAVGRAAMNQAALAPERFERTPKRCMGEGSAYLGDRAIPVADMVAAVLREVGAEARRVMGGAEPAEVRLTHPARWAEERTNVLLEAGRAAGFERMRLLAEPVAAAGHLATRTKVMPGQHVAVYDFGGGTFDVAVLRRTEAGFEVVGAPGGQDPLGGEDIDQRIIDWLGAGALGQHPDWPRLIQPTDAGWRRYHRDFRTGVREAKELLSRQMACGLFVRGLEQEVQITRQELNDLIRPVVTVTARLLEEAIGSAGLTVADLAAIFLVGGSSRIPLVADVLWQRLGRSPFTFDDPKSVVALGAASWSEPSVRPADRRTPPPPPPPPPPPVPTGGTWGSGGGPGWTPVGGGTPPPPPPSPPPANGLLLSHAPEEQVRAAVAQALIGQGARVITNAPGVLLLATGSRTKAAFLGAVGHRNWPMKVTVTTRASESGTAVQLSAVNDDGAVLILGPWAGGRERSIAPYWLALVRGAIPQLSCSGR